MDDKIRSIHTKRQNLDCSILKQKIKGIKRVLTRRRNRGNRKHNLTSMNSVLPHECIPFMGVSKVLYDAKVNNHLGIPKHFVRNKNYEKKRSSSTLSLSSCSDPSIQKDITKVSGVRIPVEKYISNSIEPSEDIPKIIVANSQKHEAFSINLYILLLSFEEHTFELIEIEFFGGKDARDLIIDSIQRKAVDSRLRSQQYRGLCRPLAGAEILDQNLVTAPSFGDTFDICAGEVLIAIPNSSTGNECTEIFQRVLCQHSILNTSFDYSPSLQTYLSKKTKAFGSTANKKESSSNIEYKTRKNKVSNHDLVSNCARSKQLLVSTNLGNKQISIESASKELNVKENESVVVYHNQNVREETSNGKRAQMQVVTKVEAQSNFEESLKQFSKFIFKLCDLGCRGTIVYMLYIVLLILEENFGLAQKSNKYMHEKN